MTRKHASVHVVQNENKVSEEKLPLLVMFATAFAHFEQHSFSYALAPLLVLVKADLSLTLTQVGIVGASSLITLVFFQLGCGYFADRYGSRTLMVGGTGFSALALFLVSVSTGFYFLVLSQILLGIGLSSYHPTGFRLVITMVSVEHKGKAISIQGVGGIAGSAFTPIIAVFLAEAFNGWRPALQIIAWVGIMATLIEFLMLRPFSEQDRPKKREISDELAPTRGTLDLKAVFLSFGFGAILLYSFFRESVFRNVSYFVPLFFESIGYSVYQAGFISSLLLGVGAIAQLCGGILADIVASSRQRYFIAGSTGLASLFLFSLAHAVKGTWLLVITVLFGFTYFISVPFLMLIASNYTPNEAQGITFALLFSSMSFFAAISSVLFGVIGENFGLRVSMDFLAVSAGIAALTAFLLPRSPERGGFSSKQ